MPGNNWRDLIHPDDSRLEHFEREEELEEQMREAENRLNELERRILQEAEAIRNSTDYLRAERDYERAHAALLLHNSYHPSYHDLPDRQDEDEQLLEAARQRRNRERAQRTTPGGRRRRQSPPPPPPYNRRSSILPPIDGTPRRGIAPPVSPVSPPQIPRSGFASIGRSPGGGAFSPIESSPSGTIGSPTSGRRNGNRHTTSSENREDRARLAREGSGDSGTPRGGGGDPTRRITFGPDMESFRPQLRF